MTGISTGGDKYVFFRVGVEVAADMTKKDGLMTSWCIRCGLIVGE